MPETLDYFPVYLKLRGRPVLLVGGGEVALRKARLLVRAGAQLRVQARELLPALHALPGVEWIGKTFDAAAIAGAALVIAASDDATLNRRVAAAAQAGNVPVNVVDDPEPSSFITPAIVDRAPLLVAISSAGRAPVLARRLREQIEVLLPANLGRLAAYIGARRAQVEAAVAQPLRRRIWERFLDGAGAARVLAGDTDAAEESLTQAIAGEAGRGEVYLVGAGPGDPDLLTLRALRLMQQCDVVLYDALIPEAILERVRRDAERVYVGKRRARHTLPQGEINAELVRRARAGQRVLRLKGGDPFVFGRGGEEIAELAAAGIAFEVVPGITAANGCAAYAGIPLTHRDYAQSCIFVTGHPRADGRLELPWQTLSRPGQTVVIYMGLGALGELCARLRAEGLPDDWPAALVEDGTSERQRVIAATLADLPQAVAAAGIDGPSLVIVGEVVRLHSKLRWFEATAQRT